MKKIVLGISAAAFALGAGALYAAAPEGPAGDVTWAEAKAKADEMWAKLDVNKDGKLDQADRDAKVLQKFDAIDTNHDGSISRDEFLAHHNAMHGPRADGPGAGPEEGHRWHRGGRGGPEGRGPGGLGAGGPGMMVLRMADANKDGVVTKAEYDAAVKAHFDRVDTNHDGKISKEERKAARDAMRARFGRGPGGPGAPGGDMPPPPPPGE
ncbi:EF-hand domain-containing protein [Novosphingobium sp. LASN5T]|uniref:EF-hand domain-containing protein n=1 Tax=Novosphingobium sp. LASN5T TaxID=2491021 RepID=UPI000F5E4A76|nr:EF-hand domain-containing protein [Novosphingobium sp. LASN5T]RQW45247.1 calcium-binding protein [Novosphingobium sp. LASN5T]